MQSRTFIIEPSYEADWRLSVRCIALIGAVLFAISVYFLQLGLWLIVPFAGLEFIAVACALTYTASNAEQKNVVTITRTNVTLEKGKRKRTSSISFERIWCEVLLETLPRKWHHTKLYLRCKQDKVEFAEFLDADEQKALSRELKTIIGPVGV